MNSKVPIWIVNVCNISIFFFGTKTVLGTVLNFHWDMPFCRGICDFETKNSNNKAVLDLLVSSSARINFVPWIDFSSKLKNDKYNAFKMKFYWKTTLRNNVWLGYRVLKCDLKWRFMHLTFRSFLKTNYFSSLIINLTLSDLWILSLSLFILININGWLFNT